MSMSKNMNSPEVSAGGGNFLAGSMYNNIRDDHRYEETKEHIEQLVNIATGASILNETWGEFTFKIEDKQTLPMVDPLSGEILECFRNNPEAHESVCFNLMECSISGNTAPAAQFMLDLLRQDHVMKYGFPENPLDEQPIFEELYTSRNWLDRRGMNHQHFPGKDKGIVISDLATEAYIYNLQNLENQERESDWAY